ncbi:MAG: mercuric transporter MerT family protein [Geminicoccaceae bacterium]
MVRSDPRPPAPADVVTQRTGVLAAGSLLGAVLASSCCILPLTLLTLGVSGAWIGRLTTLAPYQPLFLLMAGIFLAAGFWAVYLRPKPACHPGSYCASPRSDRLVKLTLWTAATLVGAAASINLVGPLFL